MATNPHFIAFLGTFGVRRDPAMKG